MWRLGRRKAQEAVAPVEVADGIAPPAGKTDEAVEAWMADHLDMTDWIFLYRNRNCVWLAERVTPAPMFEISLRFEDFATHLDEQGRPYRSVIDIFDVDSRMERYRIGGKVVHRLNDLKSPYEVEQRPPADWRPLANEGHPIFMHLRNLCKAGRGEGPIEGPASWLRADIQDWVARTVTPGADAYAYAYADPLSAVYVQPASVRRTLKGWALTLREEMFRPYDGVRSQIVMVELDLKRRRMRQIEARCFTEHNLGGEGLPPVRLNRWIETPSSLTPGQFDRLCEVAAGVGDS